MSAPSPLRYGDVSDSMNERPNLVQNDGEQRMAYQSQTKGEEICAARESARDRVSKAKDEYRKGGSLDAVNKAERALLDVIDREYEFRSGR